MDYGLASHTIHVVCANFIRVWRDLQFNVDSEQQIFEKLFSWQFYLLSELLPEFRWAKIAKKKYYRWTTAMEYEPGFTSNKPEHCLLDYGDFNTCNTTANMPCGFVMLQ